MLRSSENSKFSKNFLSIGEFSKITRASTHSLRYYERKGIFSPAYVDPETNYRYYSIEQIYELSLAKACSEIGISLSTLKDFSTKRDVETLDDFFRMCEESAERDARNAKGVALRMKANRKAYIDQITDDVLSEREHTTDANTILMAPIGESFEKLNYRNYIEKVSSAIKGALDYNIIFLAEQGTYRDSDGTWYAFVNVLSEDHLEDSIPAESELVLRHLPPIKTKVRSAMGTRISDSFRLALDLDKSKQPIVVQEAWAYSLSTDFYLFNAYYECD